MCCHWRIRNNNSSNNNNDNNKSNKPPCERLCGKKGESVKHITSGCEKLAQKNTKDDTAIIHRKFIGIFVKTTG